MNIGGVNDYNSLMASYKVPSVPALEPEKKIAAELPVSDIRENPSVEPSQITDAELAAKTSATGTTATPAKKNAQLEDISLTFNLQEEFGYLGQDSDIRLLDMEQAISDMKKDEVLHQYQYFVGSSRSLLNESEDGMVFAKF